MNEKTTISLVTTVLNDRIGVENFMQAMSLQTSLPDEVIVLDGGSQDGTWELLQSLQADHEQPFELLVDQEIGCNVARGRDLAIERARHRIIASTDIGCEWDPEWLEELIAPIKHNPAIDVVIGSWAVRLEDAKSEWAKIEFARRWPFRLEATPDSLGINRAIVYKKSVWQKVGGYPQDLTLAADDVVFDMLIRKPEYGFNFAASPTVRCYWERHELLTQFCKEERRNFFGAGEAQIWAKHFVLVAGRLFLESVSVVVGVIFLFMLNWIWPGILLMTLAITSVFARTFKLRPAVARLRQMGVKFPLIRLLWFEYATKFYGMWGYATGWISGARNCQETRHRIWG